MARAKQLSCYDCGRIYTPQGKTYYLQDKHRYICPSCAKKRKRAEKQMKREYNKAVTKSKTGMSQTYFGMIVKIFIGIVCIAMVKEGIIYLGIGILLILWGIVPFILRKR